MAWQRQLEHFAGLGYRVLAPDQRGYNLSDKPSDIDAYQIDVLAKDVVELIESTGRKDAVVVGHDWGAAVAWWVALQHPERVKKLVILNVPHPAVMKKNLKSNFRQLRKSWYVFAFQLPWLPERVLSARHAHVLSESLRKTGAFRADELDYYQQAWARPGAWRGMVNWYRAVLQKPSRPKDGPQLKMPVLILWGMNDAYLEASMAEESLQYCAGGRLERFADATHWIAHEKPDAVNDHIAGFINS